MYSADHFKNEVSLTMTELAEVLQSMDDNVFTIKFKTKVNEEDVVKQLAAKKAADLKPGAALNSFAKELASGKDHEMVCYLLKVENNLGRSLVIDLSSDSDNKFRQVDHRTIEHIIFKNTKYVNKKGAKKGEVEPWKKGEPLWDTKKLAVGNWFSGTKYYKTKNVDCPGDRV